MTAKKEEYPEVIEQSVFGDPPKAAPGVVGQMCDTYERLANEHPECRKFIEFATLKREDFHEFLLAGLEGRLCMIQAHNRKDAIKEEGE